MELNDLSRRRFVWIAAGSACAAMAGVLGVAGEKAGKFLRALKPHRYPGKVRPLDDAAVRTRGRWLG